VEIRAAGAGDVEAVLALWREAGSVPTVSDTPEGVRTLLAHDPGALLLAVADGTVTGALIAAWDGWRGELYRLAVAPRTRRRGVATALVRAGEGRLRALGALRIAAIVEGDEPSAFWSAAGYELQPGHRRFVRTLR